jgi:hypothetical protein
MEDAGGSPLAFLSIISNEARREGIRREVYATLNKEREKVLGRGVIRPLLRILLRPQSSDQRTIEYLEHAYANIEDFVTRDATNFLALTIKHTELFCLYLRPYVAESILELSYDNETSSVGRSIEVGNLARVSESIPTYGLSNVLDANPLKKYHSVWLPPEYRQGWLDVVRELASRARLIIINATRKGDGLAVELETIPKEFPDKTWLLAGVQGEDEQFIFQQLAEAATYLAEDHVSKAKIVDGEVHDAWPFCPEWVRDICADARCEER